MVPQSFFKARFQALPGACYADGQSSLCLTSGIRLFDDSHGIKATDAMEAQALLHEIDSVHIYSNSWGPGDPGWRVKGPGKLASEALKRGIEKVIMCLCTHVAQQTSVTSK